MKATQTIRVQGEGELDIEVRSWTHCTTTSLFAGGEETFLDLDELAELRQALKGAYLMAKAARDV